MNIASEKHSNGTEAAAAHEWQVTFDSISDCVWLLDKDFVVIRANKAAANFNFSLCDVLGRHCYEIVHGTSEPIGDCPFKSVKTTRVRQEVELKHSDKLLLISVDPIFDTDGELSGAVHIIRDITRLKQSEAEVMRINRVLSFVSQINQMVTRTRDISLVFQEACNIAVNYGQYAMAWIGAVDYQLKKAEPIITAGHLANYFADIPEISIEDNDNGRGPTGTAVRSGKAYYCNDIATDERMLPWRDHALKRGYKSSVTLPLYINGKIEYIFGLYAAEKDFFSKDELELLNEVSNDIAYAVEMLVSDLKRREAEQRISDNEHIMRDIIDCAPFGAHVFELSDDDKLIFSGYNESSNQILNRDLSNMIGKELLEVFPGHVNSGLGRIYREAALGSQGYQADAVDYEDEFVKGIFEVRVVNTGKNKVVVFFRDVTDKKRAEENIKRLNEELDKLVKERTVLLEQANSEMQAFAYSVSHDLRSPLRGIDGWSQALSEDFEAELADQAKVYLSRIRLEAQRMHELIDALLKLASISKWGINIENVDLSSMATSIFDEFRKQDTKRKIVISIQPGVYARGDRFLLGIALGNLLHNAWKFSSKRELAEIEFGSNISNNEQVYFVRDNGAGFNQEYAKKLFGIFQRMHKPSEFPGIGTGLATAKRIVLRHGGSIWVETAPDMGATFYWTIRSE